MRRRDGTGPRATSAAIWEIRDYNKDGSEILIRQRGRNPRRLTPRECARLMGFSDEFIISVFDTQAYKQFGNSVVVPVVDALAGEMLAAMKRYGQNFKTATELEYVADKVA